MDNLYISINAVFPFLFYMVFGYLAVKKKFTTVPFLNQLNQLVFKLFFPLMMFKSIYSNGEVFDLNLRIILICVAGLFVLLLIAWIFVTILVKENAKRGVILQALYRTNTVLFAIPLTENLFGAEGAALASMVVAFLVPIYNVLAVVILEYYRGGQVKPLELLKKIVTNPLILGAAVALLCNYFRVQVPKMVMNPVGQIAGMTTPLALFVIGGTLKFSSVKKNLNYIVTVVGIKMILVPAIAVYASVLMHLSNIERFEFFILFAAPIAVSSFTMAQNMGGDGDLAGELVLVSTVSSMASLFLWIFVLKTLGLI